MRLHLRRLFLRRILERHRPARRLRGRAQAAAPVEVIDLDDHAVGVVRQGEALLGHVVAESFDLLDAVAEAVLGIDVEAEAARAPRACPSGCASRRLRAAAHHRR